MGITHASAPDPYSKYRQQVLAAAEVKALSQLRPGRVVRDVALSWILILAAWLAAYRWTEWWVVTLAAIVVGTRYYALFIIGHDGMHRRLMPSAEANDLFCDLFIYAPIGAITRLNRRNHLLHHRHLASEDDPDRHKHACFNKSTRPEYLAFLSGLASVFPVVRSVFLARHRRGRGSTLDAANEKRESYRGRDLLVLAGWQTLLIVGLTLAFGWWGYFALWLLPLYVFSYSADLVRSFLEHSHPEADEKADHHRLITYLSNPLERWFFAPMNMNYHAAHHLWTSIPYYHLPAADRLMRGREQAAGLIWRGSYLGYLFRYFFALPLPECRRAETRK